MVAAANDTRGGDAATFLLENFGMPRKSQKELQQVPVDELAVWCRDLAAAARYLEDAVKKANEL